MAKPKKRPTYKLADLTIKEVSGVDIPANDGEGGWMVLKAMGSSDLLTYAESIGVVKAGAVPVAAKPPSKKPDAAPGAPEKQFPGNPDAGYKVGPLGEPMPLEPKEPPRLMGQPLSDEEQRKMPNTKKAFDEIDLDTLPAEVVEAMEIAEKALDELVAENDALLGEKEEFEDAVKALGEAPPADPIAKALAAMPEDVRKAFEDAQSDAKAAREEVAKERNVRLDAEFTAKADVWKGLTLKADEFGPRLRALADVDPEMAVDIERALNAANEAVTQSALFTEIGKGTNPTTGGSAYGEIQALAKAAVTAGTYDNEHVAIAAIASERPDLYARHLDES